MLLLFWSSSALSTAAPSITLALAPGAFATRLATASPGIALALAPADRQTHLAQATPGVLLALAAHAIGGTDAAGGSVVELEYNASGTPLTESQVITFHESGVSTLTLRKTE
jgi:hypothetical protein